MREDIAKLTGGDDDEEDLAQGLRDNEMLEEDVESLQLLYPGDDYVLGMVHPGAPNAPNLDSTLDADKRQNPRVSGLRVGDDHEHIE